MQVALDMVVTTIIKVAGRHHLARVLLDRGVD
jgi:hypothetical protein